ncbi:hypothetical protein HZB01_02465 [Candidatus Woesearchaeota archaeon]|nr:hypothetical protein [Candidatus Woesearchaeota archaeon]
MTDNTLGFVGRVAFIVGVVLAVVSGVFGAGNSYVISALVVLGLIVGFLNVTEQETNTFILTTVALVIVSNMAGSYLGKVDVVGAYFDGIFGAIITFITPATIVVGLKTIYALAKD